MISMSGWFYNFVRFFAIFGKEEFVIHEENYRLQKIIRG